MVKFQADSVRRLLAVLLLGVWLSVLPRAVSAEKVDWKDDSYDFSRIRRVMITDMDLAKANFDGEMRKMKCQSDYANFAQKLGCEVMTHEQAWRRVSLAIGVDLDATAKTDPDKAAELFTQNLPSVADAWIDGRVLAWENSYYIQPEHTEWEQRSMQRQVRDSFGRWYNETYYVTVPVTYPPRRIDVSTLKISFEVYDAKTGKLIFGREDDRDREDYNAQDGMYERICKSFFSDFGHKIH